MDQFTDRFVREPERKRITGVSRTQWWRLEKEGGVPKRYALSENIVGWKFSELMKWMASRARAA